MNQKVKTLMEEAGLPYFGAMSASVSHEIKNCIAIINENAGLLSDLIMMAQKGSALDPERLNLISERIQGQVRRADAIIGHMNQFAHSADNAGQCVDLFQAATLSLAVGSRIMANRGIAIDIKAPPQPVQITTSLYFVLFLLWSIMDHLSAPMPSEAKIGIDIEMQEDGPVVYFSCNGPIDIKCCKALEGESIQALVSLVAATLSIDSENGRVKLCL